MSDDDSVKRTRRPPFDPELQTALDALAGIVPSTITPDMIVPLRSFTLPGAPTPQDLLAEAGLVTRDETIAGYDGADIVVSVIEAAHRDGVGPGFLFIHGGGMIIGDRWEGVTALTEWVKRYDAVAVTVEYRLAPEFPDPVPVEDCYAGLLWVADHAGELGIDPDRLVIVGASAGGGLAAGTALLARDRRGPALRGQLLMYPMLDDRAITVSSGQVDGVGVWDLHSNSTGWTALLGDRRASDDVSIYAAPARATDLSGLPPAFIDCGSVEVFRDEDIAYAQTIWASGGEAELHVWPGGYHAFETFAPHAQLSIEMVATRDQWIRRILG